MFNFYAKAYGGIAQLGERLPCKQEVTSSNLVISIRVSSLKKLLEWDLQQVKIVHWKLHIEIDSIQKLFVNDLEYIYDRYVRHPNASE